MADKPITEQRADLYGLEPGAMQETWDSIHDHPREAEIEGSKAISAKRQADALERMVEIMIEDRKPEIRMMEEGEITETERRRRLLEGLERDNEIMDRVAGCLERLVDCVDVSYDAPAIRTRRQ